MPWRSWLSPLPSPRDFGSRRLLLSDAILAKESHSQIGICTHLSMMAQAVWKGKLRPLLYSFFTCVGSTAYEGRKKYFCHPLLYGKNTHAAAGRVFSKALKAQLLKPQFR